VIVGGVEICDHRYTLVVIIGVGLLLKDVSCRLRLLISLGCCNLVIEDRLDMDVILFVIDLLYKSCKPRWGLFPAYINTEPHA
jgi:hypothetical protein